MFLRKYILQGKLCAKTLFQYLPYSRIYEYLNVVTLSHFTLHLTNWKFDISHRYKNYNEKIKKIQ